jgi:hypothetical protein
MKYWFQEFLTWSYCSDILVGFGGIGTDFATEGTADLCGYLEYEWPGRWENIM